MKFKVTDHTKGGDVLLLKNEPYFDRMFFTRDRQQKYLTIAWNTGPVQTVTIDEVAYDLMPDTLLPLMVNQSFYFEHPENIVAWQFSREFYCIVEHDEEVSCVGFLFYGMSDQIFVNLDKPTKKKLLLLLDVFIDEFNTPDNIQVDMLRMLLKRLIIIITRLARVHNVPKEKLPDDKLQVIRKFNILVENHYRTQHSVGFYAGELNKSPKTIANLFSLYNNKSPLQIIQERLVLEAKRLLYYTDKSVKEICYDLGFEDAAYFSNFFKKHTSTSPVEFRGHKLEPAEIK
ncbi:helix-turn-helix domain-containing protein [Mucilaginibacter segetis]|uniref:Helix-turn-helix domain-containing protein n=1 Tax=Mucilaginibacter segetis TaxID=2793071 RepID=A0A934ULG2_9SPHI|nr:helix-turn-helix domain-containing protein [Mucilaginibacter segetis]MBK0378309.1 helix-turn-helix domain-containing protein [Mucilaginibacter segetis]